MWKAIEAVKAGQADCCISAGNTGALMAMSKFCLRTMATIDRPAIASIWPTMRGESIVLDVGATIGADAHQLIDFAILGAAMSRALFGINRPTVGLLNVGVEEIKGQEEVKEAGQLLREAGLMSMSYHGFVEGDDFGKGTVDVFVTEGFAGNIALKTAEGTARFIGSLLREAMERTTMAKIGYILAKGAFDRLREIKGKSPRLTANMVNGAVNQCLSRTILTALTVFMTVVILYFFGGDGIHGFAFAFLIGVIAGTYSTIYIAAPVLLWLSGESADITPTT